MPGIFPNIEDGAIVIRNLAGVCLDPPNVENGYCPPDDFTTSCQITALPSDCFAKISPSQINAIASELLCLAQTLTPTGLWDCNSVCNLSAAFQQWAQLVTPTGIVGQICATPAAVQALAACLRSGDAPNVLTLGTDMLLKVDITTDGTVIIGEGTPGLPITIDIAALIAAINASNPLKSQLATGLLSATAGNALVVSGNALFVNGAAYVPVTRNVNTQWSLTGGGSLAADRTLNLVNDVAAPGSNQFYGTNGAGTRGWNALPGGWVSVAGTTLVGQTFVDFLGIPSTAKFIQLDYASVSASADANPRVQIGDAGGIENTGYVGQSSYSGSGTGGANFSAGFDFQSGTAAQTLHGSAMLSLVDAAAFTWAFAGTSAYGSSNFAAFGGGSKALSATLDRVRCTWSNGTSVFDAGSKISCKYLV